MFDITGSTSAGFLHFKSGEDQNKIKIPSLFDKIFHKTITVKVKVGDEANAIRSMALRQKDVVHFLEENSIAVSPYAKSQELTQQFCKFINHPEQIPKTKPLSGKYEKGAIKLDIWQSDPQESKINVPGFLQRLFTHTVKLKILEEGKLKTYRVDYKSLKENLDKHGIPVDQKASDSELTAKVNALSLKFLRLPILTANLVEGVLAQIQTPDSFTKTGAQISAETEPQERVLLNGMTDARFSLKTYTDSTLPEHPVRLTFSTPGMSDLYVDGGELAARMHLSLEKVSQAAEQGNLGALLKSNQDLIEVALPNYERLFAKQEKLKKKAIPAQNLMKIVRTAVKNELLGKDPVQKGKPYHQNEQYLAAFRDRKLHLLKMKDSKEIAAGAYGKIFLAKSLASDHEKIVKYSIAEDTEEQSYADQSLLNEYNLLHRLHAGVAGGKIPGIQKAPHAMTAISTDGIDRIGLLITTRYEGNICQIFGTEDSTEPGKIDQKIFKNTQERMDAFYPLLKGYAFAASKGLGHGDIKPENIFYRGKELDLADFGDARILGVGYDTGVFNRAYTPQEDLEQLVALEAKIEANPTSADKQKFDEVFVKRDVYALGSSLFYFLTGKQPYAIETFTSEDQPPKQGTFERRELEAQQVPEEIINLIEGMVALDPARRLSIADATARWDDFQVNSGKSPLVIA
ncbi:MAG: hypothetical protein CK425_09895 [Parachlamydia sp.]|nr:MAG: hypothetical protein CK425_09895 [Parachlamydia sp.]